MVRPVVVLPLLFACGGPTKPQTEPQTPANTGTSEAPATPAGRGVSGTIEIAPELRDKVKSGTRIFIWAKRPDANGEPVGVPLAVEAADWNGEPIAFELTDEDSMNPDNPLTGDVIVAARADQDGDAMTKDAGDVEGSTRLTVPASDVMLVLDRERR
jgi:cytochrome c-type biogenesis protein CcmH